MRGCDDPVIVADEQGIAMARDHEEQPHLRMSNSTVSMWSHAADRGALALYRLLTIHLPQP